LVNKKALDKALLEWKQQRLEEGKFPCQCGHFESSHVKRMCIACHGEEPNDDVEMSHDFDYGNNCWHEFKSMDNLTLIEWFAKNVEEIK
jgi:hypothetical protein